MDTQKQITREQYQEGVHRTEAPVEPVMARLNGNPALVRLLHAALGCATEAGEFADAIKRAVFYGKELDRKNVLEELGDAEWYLGLARNVLDLTQEEVQYVNNHKLRIRFPEMFTENSALSRDLAAERRALGDDRDTEDAV